MPEMLSHLQCGGDSPRAPLEWLTVEIRVCPPTLLGQVRQALPCHPAAVPWLSRLQASSRGLLGHFSSIQMDYIESLFVSMGKPDPLGSIINPIWAAHLADVEEAWDRATDPNPDLHGKFARPAGPFLLHSDGLHRKPFCEHGGT